MADVTTPKTCIECGVDCAGRPRTKDARGRYLCRPCFEERNARAAAGVPVAPAEVDHSSLILALADEEAAPVVAAPCPSCGAGMVPGAVLCTTCGYNVRTGKNVRSVVERERPGAGAGDGEERGPGGGALTALPTLLILGCIGAAVGGGIGAAIWAAIAYHAQVHVRIIAVLVGVFTGAGMRAGVRGYTGALTGAIAAVIAAGAIAGGHYLTVSAFVDDFVKGQPSVQAVVTEEFVTARLADEIVKRHGQAGAKDQWPAGHSAENAERKEDYPPKVWAEAEALWAGKSPGEKDQVRADLRAFVKERWERAAAAVKAEGFRESFTPFDILWFGFAMVSAFLIGSGRTLRGEED